MQLMQGSRWGVLQCIRIERRERTVTVGAVTESFEDNALVCRCTCQKTIEIWESELPRAKWALPQDCGCGASVTLGAGAGERIQPVGRPRGRQRESVSITLSSHMIKTLNGICEEEKQTFSRALEDILELGLKQRELEKLAANQ